MNQPTLQELHLENLKEGDEIVILRNGQAAGAVSIIIGFDEKLKRYRLGKIGDEARKPIGTFPPDGAGYDFMSSRETPNFFYSANPKHIKEARKKSERAKKLRLKRELEAKRLFNIAQPIGVNLGYEPEAQKDIAEALAERLTEKQLITLRRWLNINPNE